jgi:hypothetical protein
MFLLSKQLKQTFSFKCFSLQGYYLKRLI